MLRRAVRKGAELVRRVGSMVEYLQVDFALPGGRHGLRIDHLKVTEGEDAGEERQAQDMPPPGSSVRRGRARGDGQPHQGQRDDLRNPAPG